MVYDHIFYESVRHVYSHVATPLIPCGPPSGGEKTTHTTWHALHKGPHSWANCTPRLVRLEERGDHPCLGARPPFGPKHAEWGACLDSEPTSPWPPHPVVPEKHVLCGAWHCHGHTQNLAQKRPSPVSTSFYFSQLNHIFIWTINFKGTKTYTTTALRMIIWKIDIRVSY